MTLEKDSPKVVRLAAESAKAEEKKGERIHALTITHVTLNAKADLEKSLFQLETIVQCAKTQLKQKAPDNNKRVRAILDLASDVAAKTSEKQLANGQYHVELLDMYLKKFATWL